MTVLVDPSRSLCEHIRAAKTAKAVADYLEVGKTYLYAHNGTRNRWTTVADKRLAELKAPKPKRSKPVDDIVDRAKAVKVGRKVQN